MYLRLLVSRCDTVAGDDITLLHSPREDLRDTQPRRYPCAVYRPLPSLPARFRKLNRYEWHKVDVYLAS